MFVGALATALVIGFSAGLLAFKVKSRWCSVHGSRLQCVECHKADRHYLSADLP